MQQWRPQAVLEATKWLVEEYKKLGQVTAELARTSSLFALAKYDEAITALQAGTDELAEIVGEQHPKVATAKSNLP